VPLLPGALHHAAAGDFPGGAERNADYFSPRTEVVAGVDPLVRGLLFSPETAGGLLVAVPAHAVGEYLGRCAAAGVTAAVLGDVRAGRGLVIEA
jgi:selenide,water dikinase